MPTENSSPSPVAEGSGRQDLENSLLGERAASLGLDSELDPELSPELNPEEGFERAKLKAGEVVSDRFVIERLAGSGGMGAVYRALDRLTGDPVALKVMVHAKRDDDRFAREARVLAQLQHPAIVRYVAHGSTARGQPYLAMDWLEGADLAQYLSKRGLNVAESLELARRLAEGLAVAHQRGIVHRDIKPSNVLLAGGEAARATLLDFGIAQLQPSRLTSRAHLRTQTGIILGTVGYMSPEQAIADKQLDARTDVFALGCVLFECLTGRPAFSGEHVAAVLAKVLRQEVPRIRDVRPELPPELDDLLTRMLAKDRGARPEDGAAVLRDLLALGSVPGGPPSVEARVSVRLSGGEQRLVSILLALVPEEPPTAEVVHRHGGELARLANGTLLITLDDRASTSAPMVSAASCALQLHERFPSARIALAMARAQKTRRGAAGPAIDRAASLLAQSTSAGVWIDEAGAALLEARFEIRNVGAGYSLVGRRMGLETPRTLLGKTTPCVGRDKELALLEATWRECVGDSIPRAVLVKGPAGQGKSRLRHEFVARVAGDRPDARILMARGDPVGAGSSFLLARQLVRAAAGLRESDLAEEQDRALRQYVARCCPGDDAGPIADFLGELVGLSSSERPSPQMRAARNDPQIMAEHLRRSFGQWLASECSARPVLVVIEDLHWGDLPSVTYLEEALRALSTRPLMVLALARPEVDEAFPNLWHGIEANQLSLGRLTPRAAERLVRDVLGGQAKPDAVARIVERADGNAFFLEELIRRVAEGGGESLPETVVALVQSRLERLHDEARRIVRAASVFGEVFWQGAVAALVGGHPTDVDDWLGALAADDIVVAETSSRFAGEREYAFRHGLVREVAYSMLTEGDATTGHKLAGEWLEAAGEKDPLTLAGHFERGRDPARAVPWLVRATQRAFDGGNLDAALALAVRGLACGADGMDAGVLCLVKGLALGTRDEWGEAIGASQRAMELLPAGSTPWFEAAARVFVGGMFQGDLAVTAPVLQQILEAPVAHDPSGPYGLAVFLTCIGLGIMQQYEMAWSFLENGEAVGTGAAEPDPVFEDWLLLARTYLYLNAGQPGRGLDSLTRARDRARHTGTAFGRAAAAMFSAWAYAQVSHRKYAERAAEDVRKFAELTTFIDWCSLFLALTKMQTGGAREVIPVLRDLSERPDLNLAAGARAHLAMAFVEVMDLDAAEREASSAIERAALFPTVQVHALAAQARIAFLREKWQEALTLAEGGMMRTAWSSDLSTLHLVHAEALMMLDKADEARAALRKARDRIMSLAATIEDPELRDSFLTNVPANARTLELAKERLGYEAGPESGGLDAGP